MGYLRNILLALGALAAAEAGFVSGWVLPLAVPGWVALPYVLAFAARRLGERGRFRLSGLAASLLGWSAPCAQFAAVLLLGWGEAVDDLWGARPGFAVWPGPELLIGLLPYVCTEIAAIDAQSRLGDLRPEVRAGLRRFQTRLLLSALLPLVAYVLISSLTALNSTVRIYVEEVALLNGAFAALLLAIFGLALPRILRSTWETTSLGPGWQRTVLEETAQRAGFRCNNIRVWQTSNLMANAAVVGFLPQHRVVLFSDALLASLGPAELAAVFAHEIGHVTRRHVWIFGAWALGVFLLADVALGWFALSDLAIELLLFGALLVLWYLSFGYLSRRFELDADLESVATTGDTDGLIRALEQVGGAHAREKSSWRHFSVGDRVRFLAANQADPTVGQRLRTRLRLWAAIGVFLFCAALVGEAWTLARALPEDRVVVALRLGRFVEAQKRAEGLDLDERLGTVVEVAGSLSADSGEETLLDLARTHLHRGDVRSALGLLDLVALRDGQPPDGLRGALAGVLDDDFDIARGLARELDPGWEAALIQALGNH